MSEENVEIVRRFYDAPNRDDRDAAFGDTHPNPEVTFQEGPRARPALAG
jgi:ketosteroid isomerase-like protein